MRDRVVVLKQGWEASQAALEKLAADDGDAAAHLAAGKYLALMRGDWEHGLAHLGKGSDERLATAAQSEQAAKSPAEELAAAELWRTAADGLKTEDKAAIQRHALEMFRRLSLSSTGLDQATAEKRLHELEPIVLQADKQAALSAHSAKSKPVPGLILRLMVVPPTGGNQAAVPTPYLAVMEDTTNLFRLPIAQSLVDYAPYQLRHLFIGQLVLPEDAELEFELEDVNVMIGAQAVGGQATNNRKRLTAPWKKGTYKVVITSNDPTPFIRITKAGTGKSVLFHSEQELKTEVEKAIQLPKGGTSKGVRIDR
jgi:hypothetical protein